VNQIEVATGFGQPPKDFTAPHANPLDQTFRFKVCANFLNFCVQLHKLLI
jgi:hypothetical protein